MRAQMDPHEAGGPGSGEAGLNLGIGGTGTIRTTTRTRHRSRHAAVLRLDVKPIPRAAGTIDFDLHKGALISYRG